MVTFAHTDRGTAEAEWLSAGVEAIPELPLGREELAGMQFLVLAAHPDDESLGVGGLLARLHGLGSKVEVLLCTAGEASHPDSPTLSSSDLAAVRLAEFAAGMKALGLEGCWRYLGLPDGGLPDSAEELKHRITEAVEAFEGLPSQLVIVAPYRADGHSDHDALGSAAADIAARGGHALLEFPIWYWLWATPDHPDWQTWARIALSPAEQTVKEKAMHAHASQTRPLSAHPGDEVLLDETFLQHFFRPFEAFAWTAPPGSAEGRLGVRETGRMPHTSRDAERIFDDVHYRDPDPWRYTTSWYERRKRALTLAALPAEQYGSGLEIGCSIGTLTADLALRCSKLLAVDASGTALKRAAERVKAVAGVTLRQLTLPGSWPDGTYDLVVLSEVGYYFAPPEFDELLDNIKNSIQPGGTLLLCHWRHPISGWSLNGDTVHLIARKRLGWQTSGLYRERDFVLETLTAPA